MAKYLLACMDCGLEFDVHTPHMTGTPQAECPQCNSADTKRIWTAFALHYKNCADKIPPEDIPVLLKNKKYFESRQADIMSGALSISENGPREFRPEFKKE